VIEGLLLVVGVIVFVVAICFLAWRYMDWIERRDD
jgi:hypothetical protein